MIRSFKKNLFEGRWCFEKDTDLETDGAVQNFFRIRGFEIGLQL